MPEIIFILGGARSGKSRYAEQLAEQSGRPKLYVATGEALDAEMRERIAEHKARRGKGWTTLETPLTIAEAVMAHQEKFILIDCLTLWLSNLMHHRKDVAQETARLEEALQKTQAQVALVSNEVGLGIVPDNALAREFRDLAGVLHQRMAALANRVVWMTAGIPTYIKGAP